MQNAHGVGQGLTWWQEGLLHETPIYPGLAEPRRTGSLLFGTWIQLLAGPILTAESPNTFFSYWSTESLWLKSRALLLFCVSYTCHFGSHSVQQTLLVLPSVSAALGRETAAPGWQSEHRGQGSTCACGQTDQTRGVTTKGWVSRWSHWQKSTSKELPMLGIQARGSDMFHLFSSELLSRNASSLLTPRKELQSLMNLLACFCHPHDNLWVTACSILHLQTQEETGLRWALPSWGQV